MVTDADRLRAHARDLLEFVLLEMWADAYDEEWPSAPGRATWVAISPDADRRLGTITLNDDEVERLRQLALDAGGWWELDNDGTRQFVTLETWRAAA